MEFILGVLFVLSLLGAYRMGSRHKPRVEVDELAKRRADQLRKDFSEVMSYSMEKALERKKVT